MENDTKLLLKKATAMLPDGSSLVPPVVAEQESEAKNAIKGFVMSENEVEMKNKRDRKILKYDSIKTPSENKNNHPRIDITNITVEKEIAAKRIDLKPIKENLNSKHPLNPPSQKSVRKTLQKPGWSVFEMYLVALNIFLSLGILYTLSSIISAVYSLNNPGSSITLNDVYQLAKSMYHQQTPIITEYCRKSLTSASIHFENSPKYFENVITIIEIGYVNAIALTSQYYKNTILSVSEFYVTDMIPLWDTIFEQISECYEDFTRTMKTINT